MIMLLTAYIKIHGTDLDGKIYMERGGCGSFQSNILTFNWRVQGRKNHKVKEPGNPANT
jgi:hypothetical protein